MRLLHGKPLIYYTIREAKKAKSITSLWVNTDSPEIYGYAEEMNCNVYRRPDPLGEDVDTSLVLKEQLENVSLQQTFDWIICLQPTSPLRTFEDIDKCVELAEKTRADTVLTVCQCNQHPYWAFELGHEKRLVNCMNLNLKGDLLISQNLPLMFYPNGAVYVTKPYLVLSGRIYGSDLRGVLVPPDRSVDLETELDFQIAEILMKNV